MSIAILLLVAALVCFIAAAFGWGRGIAIGLALWVLAEILPAIHV